MPDDRPLPGLKPGEAMPAARDGADAAAPLRASRSSAPVAPPAAAEGPPAAEGLPAAGAGQGAGAGPEVSGPEVSVSEVSGREVPGPEVPVPEVSIVVPAWRAARTLADCAGTALAQEGVTVEVILVDDASPDATFEAAQALAKGDPRIRALRLATNGGPGAARNAAFAAARGRWVAVLDADDRMRPDRLAGMVALAERLGADVLLGNLREVDEQGRPLGEAPFLTRPDRPERWDIETFVQGNLLASGGQSLGYLKPLIRRDFIARHALRYDPALRNGEDFHLVLAAYAAGARVWFDPAPGYLYTRRPGSLSHRADPAHMRALIAADAAFEARLAGGGGAGVGGAGRGSDRRSGTGHDPRQDSGHDAGQGAGQGASPRLRALLRDRRRGLQDLHAAEVFLDALRRRRAGAAARAFLERPRAAGRIARQLGEALAKRLRGRTRG